MRKKHRNDKNHGKDGWVGGNPRYGKARGSRKGDRAHMTKATYHNVKEQLNDQ
jgi:hypothetical protein